MKIPTTKRKAISPVLATVILIAITLIAAIAIAGFVFGLFGTFTKTATITVTGASCTGDVVADCTIYFQNTGTSNAAVNSVSLTYGGQTCAPAITSTTITAGAAAIGLALSTPTGNSCIATGFPAPTSGGAFTGAAALSNGGSASFTGSFP